MVDAGAVEKDGETLAFGSDWATARLRPYGRTAACDQQHQNKRAEMLHFASSGTR